MRRGPNDEMAWVSEIRSDASSLSNCSKRRAAPLAAPAVRGYDPQWLDHWEAPDRVMIRRLLDSSGFWALMTLAFLAGVALLGTSAWLGPLAEGDRAIREGRLERALEAFAAVEARFDRLPATRHLLPAAYATSQTNQLWVLYRLGRHDALIEKAATSPPRAPLHFWAGCALFNKATDEDEAEARIGWLERAADEFEKALEMDPDDWDTKFNYELTVRLVAELRKEPDTPPNELIQLLRPKPKEGEQTPRRSG